MLPASVDWALYRKYVQRQEQWNRRAVSVESSVITIVERGVAQIQSNGSCAGPNSSWTPSRRVGWSCGRRSDQGPFRCCWCLWKCNISILRMVSNKYTTRVACRTYDIKKLQSLLDYSSMMSSRLASPPGCLTGRPPFIRLELTKFNENHVFMPSSFRNRSRQNSLNP